MERGGGRAEGCVCVAPPRVCVLLAEASFQLREGHLSVSGRLRLYLAAAVRVCLNVVLLGTIPGRSLTVNLEYHDASVWPSVILMLSVTLLACPSVRLGSKATCSFRSVERTCSPACPSDPSGSPVTLKAPLLVFCVLFAHAGVFWSAYPRGDPIYSQMTGRYTGIKAP